MFRRLWPLILAFALLVIGLPLASWADWGSPPEPRSRVLSLPDGTSISATNPLPVGQRMPSVVTSSAVDPNQDEGAADIAANAKRASICCQAVGTTVARFRVGAATGGTVGMVVAGGAAANDGTGGSWCTTQAGAIWIYDVTGGGNADLQCVEESYP